MTEIDTKERIKQKAHELIMQYGARSVSMDDIANGLGISKKTIYQFYADKEELVSAVVEDILAQNQCVCETDNRTSKDAIHELFLAKECVGELLKTMNPSLLFDLQKYHPIAFMKFQKHRNEFLYNVICENIKRGILEGIYREDLRVELVARLRVESLLIPFSPEVHLNSSYTITELQQELIDLFLFSMVNQKGYKLIFKYKQQYHKQ